MPQTKKKPIAETQEPQGPQEPQQEPQEPQEPQQEPQQPQEPQMPQETPQETPQEEPQRESPMSAVIVPHPTTVRGPIESDYNKQRDDREQLYREDRLELENDYHSDLNDLKDAKSAALVTAGLNPDGSTPPDYSG